MKTDKTNTPTLAAISSIIDSHYEAIRSISEENFAQIQQIADIFIATIRSNKKILVCGNGGSAGDAQHFAGEMVNRFNFDRKPLPCIALTTDTSVITAVGNDYSFDDIFLKQVQAIGNEGDILLTISTSGNSKNLIQAIDYANQHKILTIGLFGKDGGQAKQKCQASVVISSKSTPRIQEAHILVIHLWCELIENAIFKSCVS